MSGFAGIRIAVRIAVRIASRTGRSSTEAVGVIRGGKCIPWHGGDA